MFALMQRSVFLSYTVYSDMHIQLMITYLIQASLKWHLTLSLTIAVWSARDAIAMPRMHMMMQHETASIADCQLMAADQEN